MSILCFFFILTAYIFMSSCVLKWEHDRGYYYGIQNFKDVIILTVWGIILIPFAFVVGLLIKGCDRAKRTD